MAQTPQPKLIINPGGCPDCGERQIQLPFNLPKIDDDFDWVAQDFDSYRLFMMEEMAARSAERKNWTHADMEVVIIELLAAALDRMSHALDTIQQERFLATARRPESVRRLLALIGYDAPAEAGLLEEGGENRREANIKLEDAWREKPELMEYARTQGPRSIFQQKRMVTIADYAARLSEHPLVARAQSKQVWTGSWTTIYVSVLAEKSRGLDDKLEVGEDKLSQQEWGAVLTFHRKRGLIKPEVDHKPRLRQVLRYYLDAYRMIGTEVMMEAAKEVPITFQMSVRVKSNYYRSEVRHALERAFSTEQGGFFEPGRRPFDIDLLGSDLIETALGIEGVETACLNRLKHVDKKYPDRVNEGFIPIRSDEVAICENRPGIPNRGYFRLAFHEDAPR